MSREIRLANRNEPRILARFSKPAAAGGNIQRSHQVAFTDSLKVFFKRNVLSRRRPEEWPFVPGNYHVIDVGGVVDSRTVHD
jgi:hypothetical protein